jgi:hypothetical protein
MNKGDTQACHNCEKNKTCRARDTMWKFQKDHVPCVFWQRESDTKMVDHPNHIWKKASTEYAHMNGLSWLAFCQRCGAEGCSQGASHDCRSRVVTKKYRVGGHYRREHLKNGFKIHE